MAIVYGLNRKTKGCGGEVQLDFDRRKDSFEESWSDVIGLCGLLASIPLWAGPLSRQGHSSSCMEYHIVCSRLSMRNVAST